MRKLVKTNVKLAFKLLGDIVKNVSFVEAGATGYDYDLDAPILDADSTSFVDVIVEKTYMKSRDSSIMVKELIADADDILNPDIYDRLILDNKEWTIVPPFVNDGFVIKFKVTRST